MENKFVDGLSVRPPHPKAASFVKASISFNRVKLLEWLSNRQEEWVNIDIKEAKSGKWYGEVNEWKKDQSRAQGGEWEGRSMAYESLKATGDAGQADPDLSDVPF